MTRPGNVCVCVYKLSGNMIIIQLISVDIAQKCVRLHLRCINEFESAVCTSFHELMTTFSHQSGDGKFVNPLKSSLYFCTNQERKEREREPG